MGEKEVNSDVEVAKNNLLGIWIYVKVIQNLRKIKNIQIVVVWKNFKWQNCFSLRGESENFSLNGKEKPVDLTKKKTATLAEYSCNL